jgi:hypothetical protein
VVAVVRIIQVQAAMVAQVHLAHIALQEVAMALIDRINTRVVLVVQDQAVI